jgi:cell wall-associated NlpC family hydrolase
MSQPVLVPPPPMTVRERFIAYVLAQLGKPTLWGAKGEEAFDCSGLVTCGVRFVGGPDLRATHNADKLGSETRELGPGDLPLPGDLIFFDAEQHTPDAPGHDVDEHVGIVLDADTAIDASGATSRIRTLEGAIAAGAKVRKWKGHRYRKSFRAIHRNTYLDSLEFVTR